MTIPARGRRDRVPRRRPVAERPVACTAMVDIDAAIGFVVARGTRWTGRGCRRLRSGVAPADDILANVEVGQTGQRRLAGRWRRHVASIDATCFRLAEMDDLRRSTARPRSGRWTGWPAASAWTAPGRRTGPGRLRPAVGQARRPGGAVLPDRERRVLAGGRAGRAPRRSPTPTRRDDGPYDEPLTRGRAGASGTRSTTPGPGPGSSSPAGWRRGAAPHRVVLRVGPDPVRAGRPGRRP